MASARLTFIPDILEEHLEEMGILWGQRQAALLSPDRPWRAFQELDGRITAHLQGVLAVGERGLPMVEAGLEAQDALAVFASAFSLLHFRQESVVSRLVKLFSTAKGEQLAGLRMAFSHGPADGVVAQMASLLESRDEAVALAAGEVLAFQGALQLTQHQLGRFLGHENPEMRRGGWRLASALSAALEPKAYAAAMRDKDVGVAAAALRAGAWCGMQGVLTVIRQFAQQPSPEHLDLLYLLAVLGASGDLPLVMRVAEMPALGPARFRVVGAFGHPAAVDYILPFLSDPDPASAAAAGAAFTKITGESVQSGRTARVPNQDGSDPDDFEAEFQEELPLPDPLRAQSHWAATKAQAMAAARLCRGTDLSRPLLAETFAEMDMESRWEIYLRSRFHGGWSGSSLHLEVYPQ